MALERGTHTEAPGGPVGFPPFQTETFALQLIWLSLLFILLYVLMAKIALPRVSSILDDRKRRVTDDLADAARLKEQSDGTIVAYEKSLSDARSRAQQLTDDERRRERRALEESYRKIALEQDLQVDEGNKRIAAAKDSALADIRDVAAEAVSAIVERISGRAPSKKTVAVAILDELSQ
jgi:F-type H+-transporting ATPase subunit b